MKIPFDKKIFNINDFPRRNVLVTTDQGMMIVNRFDKNSQNDGHGQWLLDHGNCNTSEVNDLYQVIKYKNDPNIFDVGSNIGTISIWLAKIFNYGKIFSFEPQRQVFYQLCGNIAINNIYNIEAFNLAISDEDGYFYVNEPNYFTNNDFGTFSLIDTCVDYIQNKLIVPKIRLDDFKIHEIKTVDLIKIDAEGMDLQVLQGSRQIIDYHAPVIFVEYYDNCQSKLQEIKNFLNDYRYNFEVRGNNLLCLK